MPIILARILIIWVIWLTLFSLRNFIKRVIFVLILLLITWFIYSQLNPIGWKFLQYTITTLPDNIAFIFWGPQVAPFRDTSNIQDIQKKTEEPDLSNILITLNHKILDHVSTKTPPNLEINKPNDTITAELETLRQILESDDNTTSEDSTNSDNNPSRDNSPQHALTTTEIRHTEELFTILTSGN